MRLYDYPPSGNGYKVRLALSTLGIPYEYVPLDILAGQTRTPEFLAKNPNGRIPLLQLPDRSYLAESNAILFYLAEGTELWPTNKIDQSRVLQWMFFEQYSHEPNIATVRFWVSIKKISPNDPEYTLLESKKQQGYAALSVMENHLRERQYFVGSEFSIADIALYAYTHVASEGGFDLDPYPSVKGWLNRVANRPKHVSITDWD
jgi:glutathione S-transferase